MNGNHVLACNARPDALRLAEDPFDLAQQDAGEIKHMNADVEQDEPFLRRELRLACKHVVFGPRVDTRPGLVADGSCLIRAVPPGSGIGSGSSRGPSGARRHGGKLHQIQELLKIGAKGFCTTRAACETLQQHQRFVGGMVVTRSTQSSDSASNI